MGFWNGFRQVIGLGDDHASAATPVVANPTTGIAMAPGQLYDLAGNNIGVPLDSGADDITFLGLEGDGFIHDQADLTGLGDWL